MEALILKYTDISIDIVHSIVIQLLLIEIKLKIMKYDRMEENRIINRYLI